MTVPPAPGLGQDDVSHVAVPQPYLGSLIATQIPSQRFWLEVQGTGPSTPADKSDGASIAAPPSAPEMPPVPGAPSLPAVPPVPVGPTIPAAPSTPGAPPMPAAPPPDPLVPPVAGPGLPPSPGLRGSRRNPPQLMPIKHRHSNTPADFMDMNPPQLPGATHRRQNENEQENPRSATAPTHARATEAGGFSPPDESTKRTAERMASPLPLT
jgi:hypothetical protein